MTTTSRTETNPLWGQPLALYHPNGKGTGAALQLEPRVNRRSGDRANCFFLELAAQKSAAAGSGGQRTPATFDWDNKLTVKLGFADVCEFLTVLEGRQEQAGGARNGLYHENGNACTLITFQKDATRNGYYLGLSRKAKGDAQASRIGFLLNDPEATGLRHLLQTGLFLILFHTQLFGTRSRSNGEP